jgi:exodeoxyribonuclease X
MKLVFLDTETTGNEVERDRLVQLCYATDGVFHTSMFKPPIPITVKSMSITHITNKMVEGCGAFAESKEKVALQTVLHDRVLVAHNAPFDVSILKNEGVQTEQFIDTLRVARALDEQGVIPEYNLQFLRYYLGLEIQGSAHDAEGDVKVLIGVFERLLAKLKDAGLGEDEALEKMLEISSQPTLLKKFTFGKYRGKFIHEVVQTDIGYLQWLLKQKLEGEGDDVDWIHTLKHYLGQK